VPFKVARWRGKFGGEKAAPEGGEEEGKKEGRKRKEEDDSLMDENPSVMIPGSMRTRQS
jgi:hypothetical protein